MLDSDQRVSAAEALAHAYFSQYHDPEDEPEAEPYDESVEAKERTLEEWKGGHGSGCGWVQGACRLHFPRGRKCPSSSPDWSGVEGRSGVQHRLGVGGVGDWHRAGSGSQTLC